MTRCAHCGGEHKAQNHFCPKTGQPLDLGPRLIGTSILEKFKVVTILGEGPIGIVLEAWEPKTSLKYAIKLIHPQFAMDKTSSDKLLSDAKKAGSLDSENLAQVFEVGYDTGNAVAVVRELLTGQCLEEKIEENGNLEVSNALEITSGILSALSDIHKYSILNLDLSPADVFLDNSSGHEIAKLTDIGEYHLKMSLTGRTDLDMESIQYFAPEQLSKNAKVDERTDVYAAGATLYHMLAGMPPGQEPQPLESHIAGLPEPVYQLVKRAMQKNPDDRFQTASEFKFNVMQMISSGKTNAQAPVKYAPEENAPEENAPEENVPEEEKTQEPLISEEKTSEGDARSVIVDMPEAELKPKSKFSSKTIYAAVAALLAVIVVIALLSTSDKSDIAAHKEISKTIVDDNNKIAPTPEAVPKPEIITVSININPPQATVFIDGKKFDKRPILLEVEKDDKLHTISAKAKGYESMERDITFDAKKGIKLDLVKIVTIDTETDEEKAPEKTAEKQPDTIIKPVKTKPAAKILKTPKPPAVIKKPVKVKKPPRKIIKKKKKRTRDGFSSDNPFG